MIKPVKEKCIDIYSWLEHYWWKNQIDIILFAIFLSVCIINTIDYGK